MTQDQMFQSNKGRSNLCFNIINLFFIVLALAAFTAMAVIVYRFNQDLEAHMSDTAALQGTTCEEMVDIAIVGAGISGAFAAWKLNEKYPQKSIHVYESNTRIGGRAYSVPIPGIRDFVADLGAMRFIPEYHPKTWEVIQELDLEIQNFTTPASSEKLFYIRGQHLLQEDLDNGNVPYSLSDEEKNYTSSAGELYRMLNRRYIDTEEDDPYQKKTSEGELLYKLGNTNQWLKYGGQEILRYMSAIGGFSGWIYSNQNLAHRSSTNSFSGTAPPPYLTVKKGMDAIPKTLIDKFLVGNKASNRIYVRHELVAVNSSTSNISITLYDKDSQKRRSICTSTLILAIHPRAIKGLDWIQAPDSNNINIKTEAIIENPAVKIYLAYDSPWWRHGGNGWIFHQITNRGEALKYVATDLPVGTVLDIGQDSKTNKSLLLIYNEWFENLAFWMNNLESGVKDPTALEGEFTPSENLMDLLQNQLAQIFNISMEDMPMPYASVGQVWYRKPYYAAWHYWAPGERQTEVQEEMIKPVSNRDIYVIGEPFSDYTSQGWIQGALETTDKMLEKYFNLHK